MKMIMKPHAVASTVVHQEPQETVLELSVDCGEEIQSSVDKQLKYIRLCYAGRRNFK